MDHEEGEQDAQADGLKGERRLGTGSNFTWINKGNCLFASHLQDHVPPEVEEARGGEVGALVVHLDGELLHLK